MKTGIELIKEERERQINEECFDAEHDAYWNKGELARAASCYALPDDISYLYDGHDISISIKIDRDFNWPFSDDFWKPLKNRIRELQKAGALIAAEIDRLQKEAEQSDEEGRYLKREEEEL